MGERWMTKASWYELLAKCFGDATLDTAEALANGEFSEAFEEIASDLGLNTACSEECEAAAADFSSYVGSDPEETFHAHRKEATRLFSGMKADPLVQPYAGMWDARRRGRKAFLIVGSESLAIDAFMGRCGVARPEGYGGPVDHIGTLLEFLSYLCLKCADAEVSSSSADFEKCMELYEDFYVNHFIDFSRYIAREVLNQTTLPLFRAASRALFLLPARQPL